ncbi:hypothetical protein [Endozoicomonas sp. Mp262]|uniref:hypothetical protein n=1 Tax=Endozoicomonas sp. Mp262 TaxID=2919499 RepID=UPI0021D97F64
MKPLFHHLLSFFLLFQKLGLLVHSYTLAGSQKIRVALGLHGQSAFTAFAGSHALCGNLFGLGVVSQKVLIPTQRVGVSMNLLIPLLLWVRSSCWLVLKTNAYFLFFGVLAAGFYSSYAYSQSAEVKIEKKDFINATIPEGGDWVSSGQSEHGWFVLTEARQNQRGYTYYKTPFSNQDGLIIEFEFAASRGCQKRKINRRTEKCTAGDQPADGFSVFLFDADIVKARGFKLGQYGGALGYGWGQQNANCGSTHKNRRECGLRGGYLGVGFDSYGNFSTKNAGAEETGAKFTKDSIVIRGSQSQNYKYISGKQLNEGIATRDADRRVQKAIIKIVPKKNGSYDSYEVTARLEKDRTEVIGTIEQKLPENLQLGFAASTGANFARHEIRNVRVRRPVQLQLEQVGATEYSKDKRDMKEEQQKVRYVLQVSNLGNKSGVNGATLRLTVPEFLEEKPPVYTCVEQTAGGSCEIKNGKPVFDLPVGATATVKLTATMSGVKKDGELVAELVPPSGYSNEDFDNIAHMRTVFLSGRVFEQKTITTDEGNKKLSWTTPQNSEGMDSVELVLVSQEKSGGMKVRATTTTSQDGAYSFPVSVKEAKTETEAGTDAVAEEGTEKNFKIAVQASSLGKDGKLPEQSWSGPGGICIHDPKNNDYNHATPTKSSYCFGGKKGNMTVALIESQVGSPVDLSEAKHVINVTLEGIKDGLPEKQINNLDFGFSYDVVTNSNDSGQGSLRQFIINANAGAGSGKMLFVPAVNITGNGFWTIPLTTALPELKRLNAKIDGKALANAPFKPTEGEPLIDSSSNSGPKGNDESLTNGGKAERPDLKLVFNAAGKPIVTLAGESQTVQYVGFMGKESLGINVTGIGAPVIQYNYFGGLGEANSWLSTGIKADTSFSGYKVNDKQFTIRENKFIGLYKSAIQVAGSVDIIRNAINENIKDHFTGIDLNENGEGSSDNRKITITGNHIQLGHENNIAIDGASLGKVEKLVINLENLISGGSVRLSSSGNIEVANNTFKHDLAAVVIGNYDGSPAALNNKITNNKFIMLNGTKAIPIDLADGNWEGDGETANTGGYVPGKPNRGIDRPVFSSALKNGKNVKGESLKLTELLQLANRGK